MYTGSCYQPPNIKKNRENVETDQAGVNDEGIHDPTENAHQSFVGGQMGPTIDRTGDASIDAFNNYTDQNMVNDPGHADDVTNMVS